MQDELDAYFAEVAAKPVPQEQTTAEQYAQEACDGGKE